MFGFECKVYSSRDGINTCGSGGGLFLSLIAYLSFFYLSMPRFIGGSTVFIKESANYGSFCKK
jgi:hypothetical protein